MIRAAALLAALVMLALAAWPHATPDVHAQDATFAVEGRVVNGTLDVGAAQLEVMLHTVTELARADTPTLTDEQGAFRFDDVPLNPQAAYGVSVVYQGALYGRDLDTSDGPPDPVTLTIYESTHDDSGIRAALASVLFASANREEQTISTLEIVRIINESKQTYVPGPEPMNLMRFGLPPNASELQVDTSLPDADYAQVDRGFALLASVPPGRARGVLFLYIPLFGRRRGLRQELALRRGETALARAARRTFLDRRRAGRAGRSGDRRASRTR